jgi:hypothetical protein
VIVVVVLHLKALIRCVEGDCVETQVVASVRIECGESNVNAPQVVSIDT